MKVSEIPNGLSSETLAYTMSIAEAAATRAENTSYLQ